MTLPAALLLPNAKVLQGPLWIAPRLDGHVDVRRRKTFREVVPCRQRLVSQVEGGQIGSLGHEKTEKFWGEIGHMNLQAGEPALGHIENVGDDSDSERSWVRQF